MTTESDSDEIPLARFRPKKQALISSDDDGSERGVAPAPLKASGKKQRRLVRSRKMTDGSSLPKHRKSETPKKQRNRSESSGGSTTTGEESDDPVERENTILRRSKVFHEVSRLATEIVSVCDQLQANLTSNSATNETEMMEKLGNLSEKCFMKVQAEVKWSAKRVPRTKSRPKTLTRSEDSGGESGSSVTSRRLSRADSVDYAPEAPSENDARLSGGESDYSVASGRLIRTDSVDYTDYTAPPGAPSEKDAELSMDSGASSGVENTEESAKDSGNPSSGHDESPLVDDFAYLDVPSPIPVYAMDTQYDAPMDRMETEPVDDAAADSSETAAPFLLQTVFHDAPMDRIETEPVDDAAADSSETAAPSPFQAATDNRESADEGSIINDDIFAGLHDDGAADLVEEERPQLYVPLPETKPSTTTVLKPKSESVADHDEKPVVKTERSILYQQEPNSSKVPDHKLNVRWVKPAEPQVVLEKSCGISQQVVKKAETAGNSSNREPTREEISFLVPHQPRFSVQQVPTGDNPDLEQMKRDIEMRLRENELSWVTQRAIREESSRAKNVEKNNERLQQQLMRYQRELPENQLFLDFDKSKKTFIRVHPELVKKMKPHQREGVKFMYDSCYGSISDMGSSGGSGCILAHCMGLGKTLQVIALINTVICYPQLKTKRIIVVCPKSTVMNWEEEIRSWLADIQSDLKLQVFYLPDSSNVYKKLEILRGFHNVPDRSANCLLIGYEAFRSLVFYDASNKKGERHSEAIRTEVRRVLINPGADLIILDEGHVIKNRKSQTNLAVAEVATKRRIILTGTPIQNNLNEYFCMVSFVKPAYLGSEKEFNEHYAKPIKEGQHKDSSPPDIRYMKVKSFILHNRLQNFVQRKEFEVLRAFLPDKYEYVLYVPLTPVQEDLYEQYLKRNPLRQDTGGMHLLEDYTFMRKIWTHPIVLERAWETAMKKKYGIKERKRNVRREHGIDSTSEDDDDNDQDNARSITNVWWKQIINADDLESLFPSNKMILLFEIIKMCQERGEKCLIFSGFVMVLNMVEHFMKQIDEQAKNPQKAHKYGFTRFSGPWRPGMDYYRIDGGTSKATRHEMVTKFNDPKNRVTRVFLISTKAGGQGINLVGANRVIILDTSWNPAVDQQGIFRIYRLGQQKPCYIYRLLAIHTMEEKVYSRAVTKQAMSHRVADKKQVDRNYNMAELEELYHFERVDMAARPNPAPAGDDLLSTLLWKHHELIYRYHTHEAMLDNKTEHDLTEAEKAVAWNEFNKKGHIVADLGLGLGLANDNVDDGVGLSKQDSQMSEPDADSQLLSMLDSACAPDYSDLSQQQQEEELPPLAVPVRTMKRESEPSKHSTIFGDDPYKELSFGGMSIIEEQRTKIGIKSEAAAASASQVTVSAEEQALLCNLEEEAAATLLELVQVKVEPSQRAAEYAAIGNPVLDTVVDLSFDSDHEGSANKSSEIPLDVPSLPSEIMYDPFGSSADPTTGEVESASTTASSCAEPGTLEESATTFSYERFKASLDGNPFVGTSTTAAVSNSPPSVVTTVATTAATGVAVSVSAAPIMVTRSMKRKAARETTSSTSRAWKNKKICHDDRSDRCEMSTEENRCRALVPYNQKPRVSLNPYFEKYLVAASSVPLTAVNRDCLALVPYIPVFKRDAESCQLPDRSEAVDDNDDCDGSMTLSWTEEDYAEVIGYSDECLTTLASGFSIKCCSNANGAFEDEWDAAVNESDRLTMSQQSSLPESQRLEMQQEMSQQNMEELMDSIAEFRTFFLDDETAEEESPCLALIPYNPPVSLWTLMEQEARREKSFAVDRQPTTAVVLNTEFAEALAGRKRRMQFELEATDELSRALKRARATDWINADVLSYTDESEDSDSDAATTMSPDRSLDSYSYDRDTETESEAFDTDCSGDTTVDEQRPPPEENSRAENDPPGSACRPVVSSIDWQRISVKTSTVRKHQILKNRYNRQHRFAPYDKASRKWLKTLSTERPQSPPMLNVGSSSDESDVCLALVPYGGNPILTSAIAWQLRTRPARIVLHPELVRYLVSCRYQDAQQRCSKRKLSWDSPESPKRVRSDRRQE